MKLILSLEGDKSDVEMFKDVIYSMNELSPYDDVNITTAEFGYTSEPLIKDEKIRKAVMAWAEANYLSEVLYDRDKDCIHSPYGSDKSDTSVCISFDNCEVFKDLKHRQLYKIAEL